MKKIFFSVFFLVLIISLKAQSECSSSNNTQFDMNPILFQTTDWSKIPVTEHPGDTGKAYWRTLQFDGLRIRMVEYSENYIANHWCSLGHIVYCIDGEMISELSDGSTFALKKGMTYQVTDNVSQHRTRTKGGVKLLIIDGDFLKPKN